jgi:hypothetical protein
MVFCLLVVMTILVLGSYREIYAKEEAFNRHIDSIQVVMGQLQRQAALFESIFDSISHTMPLNMVWYNMKLAMVMVESEFIYNAVNPTSGAGGFFQHLPLSKNGYVREANILQDSIIFTDMDRFNPFKATKIFEIVNNHYNPKRCIDVAIYRHNPRAGQWYHDRIMRWYRYFEAISFQM